MVVINSQLWNFYTSLLNANHLRIEIRNDFYLILMRNEKFTRTMPNLNLFWILMSWFLRQGCGNWIMKVLCGSFNWICLSNQDDFCKPLINFLTIFILQFLESFSKSVTIFNTYTFILYSFRKTVLFCNYSWRWIEMVSD